MTLEDFKDVYKSKTPLEKLKLLLVQTDYIRDDERNLERAKANLNDGEAGYWRREISAMEDRIKWLFEQLAPMLEAQEPRVMTLEEVKRLDSDCYYLESMRSPGKELREIVGAYGLTCVTWPSITWARQTMGDSGYGKTWRCWTSRPTDEQREATPWLRDA